MTCDIVVNKIRYGILAFVVDLLMAICCCAKIFCIYLWCLSQCTLYSCNTGTFKELKIVNNSGLSYDVTVIQWIKSCQNYGLTTCYITLLARTSNIITTMQIFIEINKF